MSVNKKSFLISKLWNVEDLTFDQPLKDVHTARLPISGCAWIETGDGIVLIDTMIDPGISEKIFEKINGKIKYIIYTHGHGDHVGGAKAFMRDNPEVIANKYLPDRLDKYKMIAPYRARINAQQFNLPEIVLKRDYVYPTTTFIGQMTLSLGDKTFELRTARGETDDVCWVHVPEINTAFIGDLLIRSFPNIGNPWKPTRFALDWVKTLEKIRSMNLDYVFYGGAGNYHTGEEVYKALTDNIDVIRSLHDQTVDLINEGVHITEMIHQVEIPKHLKKSPYLNQTYSRTEFFVFNVYRWYHGYFDGNPAHLLPRPEQEVLKEIFNLIGEEDKILNRVKELIDRKRPYMALEILDIIFQVNPDNKKVRGLRLKILESLHEEDACMMSRNVWKYFMQKDKKFLNS